MRIIVTLLLLVPFALAQADSLGPKGPKGPKVQYPDIIPKLRQIYREADAVHNRTVQVRVWDPDLGGYRVEFRSYST